VGIAPVRAQDCPPLALDFRTLAFGRLLADFLNQSRLYAFEVCGRDSIAELMKAFLNAYPHETLLCGYVQRTFREPAEAGDVFLSWLAVDPYSLDQHGFVVHVGQTFLHCGP
jgi:hypothetical protein